MSTHHETEGWLPFLTERDKAVLEASGPASEEFGLGTKPVLLVVDNFYAAVGMEREPIEASVQRWPLSCGLEGWAAIDRTVGLLRIARDAGVPVIYVTSLRGFPSKWFPGKRFPMSQLTEHERFMAHEIVEEIAPHEGELVIAKSAPSAFHGTPLVFHLNAIGADTVIVCGETTSGCIRATVVDATTYRFRVGVVVECCFDRTEASHWINLFDMDQKYADMLDVQSTASYFAGLLTIGGDVAGG